MLPFEEGHELYGNHLEADTRVVFHVNHTDKNSNDNIIVRGNDTDIAIILNCNANLLTNSHLWYYFSVDYNNSCFRCHKILQMFDLCASSTRYLCVYRKRLLSIILQRREN